MVLLDLDPNRISKHCKCVDELNYQQKLTSLEQIFESRHILSDDIERLIIYCYIDYCKVGLNSVCFTLKRGLNITCLCNLKDKSVSLHLSGYFLSNLEKVPSNVKNCEAFVIAPKGHKRDCSNSILPSLYEKAYASTFINGLTAKGLQKLWENKEIPTDVYHNRPTSFVHMPFFHLSVLRNFYCPLIVRHTLGCQNPLGHLETNLHQLL